MGYLKTSGTDRVTLPSDPAYWVEMKRKLSYGDKLRAQEAMLKVSTSLDGMDANGENVITEVESAAYFTTILRQAIVDWNLDDEEGRKLEINDEAIRGLEDEDGEFLMQRVRKMLRRRPREKEIPFDRRSPQPSQDSLSQAPAKP